MADISGFIKRSLWEAYGETLLSSTGLYEVKDPTYGRCDIPFSAMESRLHSSENVDVWFGKAALSNGKDWSWYQVWESRTAPRPSAGRRRPDIIFVHGTGVHSGTLASHSRRYLDAGFRLIVPDLVSHGYSSGRHVYQRQMSSYTDGLHAVLHDVARRDDVRDGLTEQQRTSPSRSFHQQTFMLGLSFGGTVALHYALDYPGSVRESQGVALNGEIPIDGLLVVGPILGYSPQNIPIPWYMARAILSLDALGAGATELMVPHKKCLDKDPKVYKTLIDEDKRSHQGAFRAGHLLCINEAVCRLHQLAPQIHHPVYIQQGGQDRVACPRKTVKWIQRLGSKDKRMGVYPVCQHVIYRKAKTAEEDEAGRVACIEDGVDWMLARVPRRPGLNGKMRLHVATGYHSDGSEPCTPSSANMSTPSSSSPASFTEQTWEAYKFGKAASNPSTPCASERSWSGNDELAADSRRPSATSVNTDLTDVSDGATSEDEEEQERHWSSTAPLTYASDVVALEPGREVFDHPLLAATHKTTLPTLAVLCPERRYRPDWLHSQTLRPFDIDVFPHWPAEVRAELDATANCMTVWSSFS